ncbi:hypothetical protein GCM10011313_02800 [Mycetocola zhadangensis]|nr:hypothetical protein GCM10011313_02800 [Mycetocola zhadangensis]
MTYAVLTTERSASVPLLIAPDSPVPESARRISGDDSVEFDVPIVVQPVRAVAAARKNVAKTIDRRRRELEWEMGCGGRVRSMVQL